MDAAHGAFESALAEIESLKRVLKKSSTTQVRSSDEVAVIKATAYSWFNTHKAVIAPTGAANTVEALDSNYKQLLLWCDRHVTRAKYVGHIKSLKAMLIAARANAVASPTLPTTPSVDTLPDFGKLVADPKMQRILANRWRECIACVTCNAPLAATVMMGGLLEAMLLARIHREANKTPIFAAKGAPVDPKTGKKRPLNDWTLQAYIDVAHELKWITVSAMSVSIVLRDYRNYVHPHKELSHDVELKADDAVLLWEVSKTISRQVVKSAP